MNFNVFKQLFASFLVFYFQIYRYIWWINRVQSLFFSLILPLKISVSGRREEMEEGMLQAIAVPG